MARTVADAAALLTAMVGFDPADAITKAASTRTPRNYTDALEPDAAKGLRIGVPRKRLFGSSPPADALVDRPSRS